MSSDIREILKNQKDSPPALPQNHRIRFEEKLMKELHAEQPKRKINYQKLYIAASIILMVGMGAFFYNGSRLQGGEEILLDTKEIRLGTISPELETIESYYINTINYELSQLEVTESNKELFEGYLKQLESLTKEYKTLTLELNNKGVNDNTINALIGNLKLRLQLLKRMQQQLQKFKNPNQNEVQTI